MNLFKFTKIIFFAFITLNISAQTVEKISEEGQFGFLEGPVWDGDDLIYFTDIPKSKVHTYKLSTNTFSEAFDNTNRANGLMFDKNYRLLVCEGETGRITRRSIDGRVLKVLTSRFKGVRYNSPNDLCVDKKGGIYFTDPNFGTATTHQAKNRLYYRNNSGRVTVEDVFDKEKPNGVIISRDGRFLYVNNSVKKRVIRYRINQNTGRLSNRSHYATLAGNNDSGADGMAIDTRGNLYVTSRSTVQIFDGSSLTAIKTINFPEKTTNCTFGGRNKNILFVTATKNLYRVTGLRVKGVRPRGVQHPFDLPNIAVSSSIDKNSNKDLSHIKFDDKISINPNPIDNSFKIDGLDENVMFRYDIKNISGGIVNSGRLTSHLNLVEGLDVLNRGVYIVGIHNIEGNTIKRIKFIKN